MPREKNIQKLRDSILIAFFSIIILICSRIAIPWVIPFTLQSLGIFLTLGILGGKKGFISLLLYLIMGFIGIPISASGVVGPALFFTSTFGYLIGWILCSIIFWIFETKMGNSNRTRLIFLSIGTIICYVTGTVWFMLIYSYKYTPIGLWTALCYCVFPFIIFDAIKLLLANIITDKLHKRVKLEK